jgi:hypothetical protein
MDWAVTPAREPAKKRIPVDDELFMKKNNRESWNSFWHLSKRLTLVYLFVKNVSTVRAP